MDRVVVPALRDAGVDPDSVAIAHCPERVIPGAIVKELRENARVVGGRKPGDAEWRATLYASFTSGAINVTDNVTAELVKVIENTYRDINIAFANEFALLREELGVDAHEAIALANHHPRVEHPFAGSGRRRPLHPGRSAFPLERQPVRHGTDSDGQAHQRAHAAHRGAPHRRIRRAARRRDRRDPRRSVQGERRRHARIADGARRGAAARARLRDARASIRSRSAIAASSRRRSRPR